MIDVKLKKKKKKKKKKNLTLYLLTHVPLKFHIVEEDMHSDLVDLGFNVPLTAKLFKSHQETGPPFIVSSGGSFDEEEMSY